MIKVVDGERFEVVPSVASPGSVDITWLSGPNPGYGFTTTRSDDVYAGDDCEPAIRSFLQQINPETGFID